jgi:glutathione synthase/RimK-type ligase-like ATP-grasp enzyme
MKRPSVLGICRERIFSPGKVEDDAAIMGATLAELERAGWLVQMRHAEEIDSSMPRVDNVLSMAQSDRVLNILAEWSRQGTRAVNTTSSIRNCYRKPLIHVLSTAGISIPRSLMVTLQESKTKISLRSSDRVWLKRGDVHAIEEGDVASVTCRKELEEALEHFRRRDISDILIQEHVQGLVVKFYGVGRGEYFKAYSSSDGEEITSRVESLQTLASQAAEAAGLEVYGGDAVLTEDNGAVLIDLNDWPSFSRCCQSAAESIAAYVSRPLNVNESLFLPFARRQYL